LDIRLPGKLGTEVCQEVKSHNKHLPVLFFSAHAKEADILDEYGADGFIEKPYDLKLLVNTINQHITANDVQLINGEAICTLQCL
jgi:DNA-binding response OmpR family regulator